MELNLGRVVGSIWYSGIGITGNSTTPTKYPDSGVTKALADDMYLNVIGSDRGNVYRCSTGGDADTAEWVYVGSILGASPDVINNLESTSTTKALSANQGKVLKDILDNAGLEPLVVTPTLGQVTYTASLVIEDKTTTFTVTDIYDNTGTYSYTGQGGTTATVNITIGTSIGLPQSGAIIKSIASSNARIKSYALYDSASTAIFSETPSLWTHITDDEQNIIPSTNITDGANTYKSGIISKIFDGVRTVLYPITHAKAVWFSKARNETVYDKIEYMDDNIAPTEVSPSGHAYSAGDFLIYNNELYKVVAAIAVGQSLTVGTNIQKQSAGAELSNLKSSIGGVYNSKITLVAFSDLSKYGIATSSEQINATLEDICKKVPAYCEVKIHWTGNDTTRFGTLANQMPEMFGSLCIHKTSSVHPCVIEFISYNSGNHYVRNYDYINSANHLSDWVNLSKVDSIDTTKQIANGVIANWSAAESLSTGYVRYFYGANTNFSGGVAVSSLRKGILYKVTITGTCSNVVNDIEAALVLKTSNTSDVDTDSVAWGFGKTTISGTSFAIETYISIPKNVSPTYCQYYLRKSSSSTSPTVNNIQAKWEEICTNEAIDTGDYDIQNRISNIEPTSRSLQSYSAGEYFTHGSSLKKVTSAIASGDTIGSGNTEDTTVGEELTEINSNLSVIGNIYSTTTLSTTSVPAATDTVVLQVSNIPLGTYIATGILYGSTSISNTGGMIQIKATGNQTSPNTVQNTGFLFSGSVSNVFQITNTSNAVSVNIYCTNVQTLTNGKLTIVRIA